MASLFHVVVLLLALPLCAAPASSSDAQVLAESIKPALEGPSPNLQLSSWNSSLPPCRWRGLQWSFPNGSILACSSSSSSSSSAADLRSLQVVSIHLPAAALSGFIPPEITSLSSLRSLFLGVNKLSGPLPLELGNCPSLSDIDLSSNSLLGPLPSSLWNLCAHLLTLRLHGNNLSGPLPTPSMPDLACGKLKVLDLGANKLSGLLPPAFLSGLAQLQELDLSSNSLSGPIPDSIAYLNNLQRLNLSHNNFTGPVLPALADKFGSAALDGGGDGLCGAPPLKDCARSSGGLSSGAVAAIVIGLMSGVVVLASLAIGWYQGRRWKKRGRRVEEEDEMEVEDGDGDGGEGKLMVFQGGEHLTLEDVLNATGQVMEKTNYGTVYKAKLSDGATIALRLFREGSCMDLASCLPVIRQLGRLRHENLVPLRGFYQGKRGEKLLIYDYFHNTSLHELLHGKVATFC